jgi:hypothetical protein
MLRVVCISTHLMSVYTRWCLCAMLVALNGGVTVDCGLVTGGLWMILKLWTDGLRTVLISDAFALSTGEIAMV